MKTPMETARPRFVRHGNPSSSSLTSDTAMNTHIHNGYNDNIIKNESSELSPEKKDEILFNNLVKFVKDKLNTSTLSLAEFKKLLLLQPSGKC